VRGGGAPGDGRGQGGQGGGRGTGGGRGVFPSFLAFAKLFKTKQHEISKFLKILHVYFILLRLKKIASESS